MSLYSHPDGDQDDGWLASINTTPLVDVLLVLLIVFLVSIPLINASIAVNLPVESTRLQGAADTSDVVISVDKNGNLYFNNLYTPDIQALSSLMAGIASTSPQPQLQIRADADVQYAHVGQVIATAQGHGFTRVSLITEALDK